MKVAILGASGKPQRYSYKANNLLREKGHDVYLVNPFYREIDGKECLSNLSELPSDIHTLTIYLNPDSVLALIDQIEAQSFIRIILNPGSESIELEEELSNRNISFLEACTLVMLNTRQF